MGQDNSQGHALFSLVRGVAKHKALIPSTNIVFIPVNVHSLGDVRALFLQGNQHIAGLVVKACKEEVKYDI